MSKKRKNINIEILEEIREPLQSKITQNNGFINQSINNTTTTSFINHCIKPQITCLTRIGKEKMKDMYMEYLY